MVDKNNENGNNWELETPLVDNIDSGTPKMEYRKRVFQAVRAAYEKTQGEDVDEVYRLVHEWNLENDPRLNPEKIDKAIKWFLDQQF